ncbi:MAG: response regulator transcription factor [Bacteroidaceae bacterium]|nr:response regulator transcription factor [Bacteroidaceae bacterium]
MKRILIVDDEPDLCEILRINLEAEGYETEVAHSATEALGKDVERCNLAVLDVMMPGMSGFEMAERMRTTGIDVPIIFLTAKDREDDKLQGFALGADDYVSKPFSVRELMARVKAVLSRATTANDEVTEHLAYEGLTIDMAQMKATVDGEGLNLTKTELELLRLFLSHRGQVFSRQQLLSEVWPSDVVVTDRTVDVNITRLRKKLGHYGQYIATRQGYGYVFE